ADVTGDRSRGLPGSCNSMLFDCALCRRQRGFRPHVGHSSLRALWRNSKLRHRRNIWSHEPGFGRLCTVAAIRNHLAYVVAWRCCWGAGFCAVLAFVERQSAFALVQTSIPRSCGAVAFHITCLDIRFRPRVSLGNQERSLDVPLHAVPPLGGVSVWPARSFSHYLLGLCDRGGGDRARVWAVCAAIAELFDAPLAVVPFHSGPDDAGFCRRSFRAAAPGRASQDAGGAR